MRSSLMQLKLLVAAAAMPQRVPVCACCALSCAQTCGAWGGQAAGGARRVGVPGRGPRRAGRGWACGVLCHEGQRMIIQTTARPAIVGARGPIVRLNAYRCTY